MAALVWDATGEKRYETGVDHGVLYPEAGTSPTEAYTGGVVWNGLTGVTESPSGAEATPQYADNIKYLNLISAEDYGMTVEAFTYPDEFAVCDGSVELATGVNAYQQARKGFGFSFRTMIGDDVSGQDAGYKLHLCYGCLASPSEKAYVTINDSPEAIAFSWEFTTTPVNVTGYRPTALITIDSTKADKELLAALEVVLYGSESEGAVLPTPDEVVRLLTPAPAG